MGSICHIREILVLLAFYSSQEFEIRVSNFSWNKSGSSLYLILIIIKTMKRIQWFCFCINFLCTIFYADCQSRDSHTSLTSLYTIHYLFAVVFYVNLSSDVRYKKAQQHLAPNRFREKVFLFFEFETLCNRLKREREI